MSLSASRADGRKWPATRVRNHRKGRGRGVGILGRQRGGAGRCRRGGGGRTCVPPGTDDLVASVVVRDRSSGRRVLATVETREEALYREGVAMTDKGGRETGQGAGAATAG